MSAKWASWLRSSAAVVAAGPTGGAGRRSRLPGRYAGSRVALWYYRWQYRIIKSPVTVVPQGEIALVVAADGPAIPAERILGKVVDSDNFQNARKFLLNGGEKGRQLGILTAGTYRINRALFAVITAATAHEHGMLQEQLHLQRVERTWWVS